MVVFANHDLLTDPPFSELDLVSCCNLLIYLRPEMQRRVLRRIHHGLSDGGHLFPGQSESVGQQDGPYSVVDKSRNLLRARTLSDEQPTPLLSPHQGSSQAHPGEGLLLSEQEGGGPEQQEPTAPPSSLETERLHHETPMQDVSGLLVDQDFNVVHFTDRARGHLGFED